MYSTTGIKQEEQPVSLDLDLFTTKAQRPLSRFEWAHCGEWSFPDPIYQTPAASIPLRQVPLARSIRGTERHAPAPVHYQQYISATQPSKNGLSDLPPSSDKPLLTPTAPPAQPEHIPRPPNAFMLYRSDFLKRRVIPSHVERRQQNLSRIAGECWNLLSTEEKGRWQDEAARVLAEHQRKNPNYKFTPAPRGSRRAKSKGQRSDTEGHDRIREIRETYTLIAGPAAAPVRRRRVRGQQRNDDTEKVGDTMLLEALGTPLPPSIPPSPSLASPSPGGLSDTPALPPFFPQYSFPHVVTPRRPSTSLGFTTCSNTNYVSSRSGLSLTRPASAASSETGLSDYLRDLDITPTAANFGNISASMPSTSSETASSSIFTFSPGLLEAVGPATQSPSESPSSLYPTELPQEGSSGTFLGSLYSDDHIPFMVSPFDNAEYAYLGENYFSHPFDCSMAPWDFGNALAESPKPFLL